MYRGRSRPCPACSSPMTRVPLQEPGTVGNTVEIDRCERCGGVYLDFFDGEPIGLAREAIATAPERRTEAPAAAPRCPDCETDMVERAYLDDGPMLSRCEMCLAVFVSRERLEQLARATVDPVDPDTPPGWLQRVLALFRS